MTRPRAGLDLDGCLYNWSDNTRSIIYRHTGQTVPPSTTYNTIQDTAGPKTWRWLWDTPEIVHAMFSEGESYGDGIAAAKVLADHYDLVIVTKRPPGARIATLEWLAAQRIPATEVYILDPKSNANKSEVPCDFYVDDSPAVVEELVGAGKAVYLLDRPWNQECTAGERAKTWYDILVKRGVTR